MVLFGVGLDLALLTRDVYCSPFVIEREIPSSDEYCVCLNNSVKFLRTVDEYFIELSDHRRRQALPQQSQYDTMDSMVLVEAVSRGLWPA